MFARKCKKDIAKRWTDLSKFKREADPVSLFMAGSPGAGKTEASIELLSSFSGEGQVLRIDPDELREEFKDYCGSNSYLFQKAVSVLVDKIHDMALDRGQTFIMDGTFANYDKAYTNISRSLKRGRLVQILYVYQDPVLAWRFVQAREKKEGRRILTKHFIEQYFAARDTVNCLKRNFGKKLIVDLLIKDFDNSTRSYKANVDKVDNHIKECYTREELAYKLSDR